MPTATIQDIIDAGFRAEQFGTPADWSDADGYVARFLARAEAWARGRFGAGYDTLDAASPAYERVRSAELCWTSAQLWKARAAFIDSNAASSREDLAYMDRREYLNAAERAFACADDNMAYAKEGEGEAPGTGLAVVAIETGPYARPAMGCGP